MRFLFIWLALWASALSAASRLVVLDVGEGQAVLLQQGGRGVLFDTGHPGRVRNLLDRLRDLGVSHLDHVILTHLHPDHAGGYFRLREAFPRTPVYWNGQPLPKDVRPDMVRWVDEALRSDGRSQVLRAGGSIGWEGWQIRVLWPGAFSSGDLNRHSLVLLIERDRTRILIMGDAEAGAERALLNRGRLPQGVDVLVVGHHGAADATTEDFLRQVQPARAVISVNAGNIRGYPSAGVIQRLAALGIPLQRTDQEGDVVIEFPLRGVPGEP